MSDGHLIICAIGPVQGFIGAARRTRDLWYGSAMLAGLSAVVARRLHGDGGNLVFPPPQVLQEDGAQGIRHVSNHVVGLLPAGLDPADWMARAEEALREEVVRQGCRCLEELGPHVAEWIDTGRFGAQLETAFELHAAWAPLKQGYQRAYRDAIRGLASRKFTRDFTPLSPACGGGSRKSSLDGVLDSVLTLRWSEPRCIAQRQRFGIDRLEGLDALGLIKRVLGRVERYPALTRVALQPWVEALQQHQPAALKALASALQPLVAAGLVTKAPYDALPYDGQLVLRTNELASQIRESKDVAPEVCDQLLALQAQLTPLVKAYPLPPAYVALLAADADGTGAALWHMGSQKEHAAFSQSLLRFSGEADAIVQRHGGRLIYTGGDDVLAVLPVERALAAARDLRDAFGLLAGGDLSVGLAYAHVMTPLGQLRQMAAQALHLAKEGMDLNDEPRAALGLMIQPRGGGQLRMRGRWSDPHPGQAADASGYDRWLQFWVDEMRNGGLPRGAPALLRDAVLQAGDSREYLKAVLKRSLARRRLSAQSEQALAAWLDGQMPGVTSTPVKARKLIDGWLAARWLARQSKAEGASDG